MPAKSDKQQKFFGLVHAVKKGEKSPHEVSSHIRKVANKIGAKDAEEFASGIAELRTKRAMLSMLKELQEPMYLNEDDQEVNPVAKEFSVKEDYESYVRRHLGQPFTPKELEAVDNFQQAKPTKIERTELRYETTDTFGNSTTIVIKKMKDSGQLSFNAFTKHSNTHEEKDKPEETDAPSPESNGPGAPAPESEPSPSGVNSGSSKEDVIITKSTLFTDDIKGGAILSEFLKKLDL
jgi:hypothetical protein